MRLPKPRSRSVLVTMLLMLAAFAASPSQQIGVDVDLSVDKSDWVDPTDPLHRPSKPPPAMEDRQCFGDEHMQHYIEENKREYVRNSDAARGSSVDVLLKHILRNVMRRLNIDPSSGEGVYRNAGVSLSAEELKVIRKYVESEKAEEEIGLREHLRYALENFLTETMDSSSKSSLFSVLHRLVPYIIIANILLLPPAIIVVCRSIFTIRQLFVLLLLAAFSMSYYFAYNRKYQEVLAQRMERVELNVLTGAVCTPRGVITEAYDALLSYVRVKGKSECLQAYEDILIEPILLVDPLQVLGEVVSSFVLSPLTVAGGVLNKFFNDFFVNTPIPLAVLKGAFLVVLLFYLSGYRIRTLVATIEPAVVRYFPYPAIGNPQRARITAPVIVDVTDTVHQPMLEHEKRDTSGAESDGEEDDASEVKSTGSRLLNDSNVTTRRRRRSQRQSLLSHGNDIQMEVYE